MNHTRASCGHSVIAEGAPGSSARKACERRTCGLPRCRSGLPAKFTQAECEAYCTLLDMGVRGWTVDRLTKDVLTAEGEKWVGLVEFLNHTKVGT